MITEKDIRTILHNFTIELAEYIYHYNYKYSLPRPFKKGKTLIYKKYTKAILDKIKEKKFNTYKVNTKTKDLGNGVSERTITIKKDK